MNKLQHIYDKHARDFGLTGTKNAEQLQMLSDALQAHLIDPETTLIQGHYRGQEASLHYNSRTQNVVVTGSSNNLITGFKVSQAQAGYISRTGRLN